MRNRNTLSGGEYVFSSFYYGILVFLVYQSLLFCPIEGLSYKVSLGIFAGTDIALLLIGILMTFQKRRNNFGIFINAVSGVCFYFFFTFWRISTKVLKTTAIITGILLVLYVLTVALNFIRDRREQRTSASILKCLSTCFLNARTIILLALSIVLIPTLAKPLLGLPIMEVESNYGGDIATSNVEGETISGNIDTILLLQEEEWVRLSTEERLDVLTTVADIEANYLGIPETTVGATVLDENVIGYYDDTQEIVNINLIYLSTADAQTLLHTICHEMYHRYQFKLVELYTELDDEEQGLYIFNSTREYKEEFANYVDGSEDYAAYAAQWCESDADEYAVNAVWEYYYHINLYNIEKE